jgi:DMSO/TMAO reductase YedYZ molybdopterin-dependent catalytic subunit
MMTCKLYINYLLKLNRKTMLQKLAVIVTLVFLLGTAVCGCNSGTDQTTSSSSTIEYTVEEQTGELEPIVVPTMPDDIPPYLGLDPETGLTMTGTPTEVDFDTYRLKVTGKVDQELSLTYDDVRRMPKITATPTLECVGYFKDTATWSGASLKTILEMAKVQPGSTKVVFKGADGYSCPMFLDKALAPRTSLPTNWRARRCRCCRAFRCV